MSRSDSADPVVPADYVEDNYSPTISNVASINGPDPRLEFTQYVMLAVVCRGLQDASNKLGRPSCLTY